MTAGVSAPGDLAPGVMTEYMTDDWGVFVRSAGTLASLPARVFGETIHELAELLSRVVPNLMLYVPERALLTGEAAGSTPAGYVAFAAAHTLGWALALLGVACLLFRRRDLT